MGHHDKVEITTDQEAAIIDLFKMVAKARGMSQTFVWKQPLGAIPKGMGEPKELYSLSSQWCVL